MWETHFQDELKIVRPRAFRAILLAPFEERLDLD
jgi:hypothetical protein